MLSYFEILPDVFSVSCIVQNEQNRFWEGSSIVIILGTFKILEFSLILGKTFMLLVCIANILSDTSLENFTVDRDCSLESFVMCHMRNRLLESFAKTFRIEL
jgi:hypothetical protein